MLHQDLIHLVCQYVPYYKLLDWIDITKLDWGILSCNEHAGDLLTKYLDPVKKSSINILAKNFILKKVDWEYIAQKSMFKYIIEANMDKILMEDLSMNEYMIDIIEKNLDKVVWDKLSFNSNAMHILKNNIDKINWRSLHRNKNSEALSLIIKYKHIDYKLLCYREERESMEILKNNIDKIDWFVLSGNPYAIDILKNNLDKVVWNEIVLNKNATDIVKQNIDKISNRLLFINTNAVEIIENIINQPNNDDDNEMFGKWDCYNLSINVNATHLLRKYPHMIDYNSILYNYNAMDIIKDLVAKTDDINWTMLSSNKGIFTTTFNKRLERIMLKIL